MVRDAVRQAMPAIMLALLAALAGCEGDGHRGKAAAPATPASSTPSLKSIEVTPSLATAAAGTTTQFTATGLYTDNTTRNLTAQVTWASSNTAVATVNNDGVATTVGAGNTTVSAATGALNGQTTLTVTDATLVSIEVSPVAPSIANGRDQQFTATGLYSDNSTQDVTTQVTWSASNPAVATVSNAAGSNGLASAVGLGNTAVSAVSGAVSGETTLNVTAATLVSIEVSPAAPSIANGLAQEFTATGVYSDNSTQDLTTQVTWASS
ncbi:MAG: LigC protein, partial [Steroidobacteraceae bacterium]|nr:LigC protein [Steroidobacteraceae bacterium]